MSLTAPVIKGVVTDFTYATPSATVAFQAVSAPGEIPRNAHTRGNEHLASLSRRKESSILWMHGKEKHSGSIPQFCMSVRRQFKDDAMLRQVSEAVMINKEGKENVMNSKNEWNYINLPNVAVE